MNSKIIFHENDNSRSREQSKAEAADKNKFLLFKSGLIAFLIEFTFLTAIGWQEHWIAHPQKTTLSDESRFIEAQVFEMPHERPHLVETKKQPAVGKVQSEPVLSKKPGQGKTQKTNLHPPLEEQNKTEEGPQIPPTHGPVVVYSPKPVIPSHLLEMDIQGEAVIDFYVNAQGVATPHLMGSTGNEELDALTLATVKKWVFRPAEKNHKPVEDKVRLRIVFEVK